MSGSPPGVLQGRQTLPHLSVRNLGLRYHMQPTLQASFLVDSAVKWICLVLLVNLLTAFILQWS